MQFATGTAELGTAAREGLAKFSGIVASYPTLRFQVEGHTDSAGRIETNNELSLWRATAARGEAQEIFVRLRTLPKIAILIGRSSKDPRLRKNRVAGDESEQKQQPEAKSSTCRATRIGAWPDNA